MKTLVTVESISAGGLAYEIVKQPGASQYFRGSLVLYQTEAKQIFKLKPSEGIISSKMALKMASLGKKTFKSDHAISLTGNAGPESQDNKDIGEVYIALDQKVYYFHFQGERQAIQKAAIKAALELLKKAQIVP